MNLYKHFHFLSVRNLYFLVGLVWFSTSCSNESSIEKLKNDIQEELSQVDGDFGIAFKDLSNNETLFINEKEVFHAASTMKTPVMIEVFKQATAGKFSLNDSMTVINEFKSIVDSSLYALSPDVDSEQELYTQVGSKKKLYDLVYDMIIVSSNLATNNVIELVGAKNVTQTMRNLGALDIQVLRGVEDQKAYDAGLSNTTTPLDLMIIFEKLAKGEAVNKEADQSMINILLHQHFNEIIPAQLPKNVEVAHKTGSITGVQHDSGIVMLPDGSKYVLVMLSKSLKNPDDGIEAMANASKLIYDHVLKQKLVQ